MTPEMKQINKLEAESEVNESPELIDIIKRLNSYIERLEKIRNLLISEDKAFKIYFESKGVVNGIK